MLLHCQAFGKLISHTPVPTYRFGFALAVYLFFCLQNIPSSFANQYILQGDHTRRVYLQIPNGGTWPAKCTVSLYGEHDRARIHSGWTELVQDNCLQVGDAIVFELMEQQPKVTLKIHVFRA